MKFFAGFKDKMSIAYLREQALKNAYGNSDTFIAGLDPRILLVWYGFFGVAPWFINDVLWLWLLFAFMLATALMARIAPLVLFLFGVGILSQSGFLLLLSLFFGGNRETLVPLMVITLKFATVSLASLTVFSGLEPDRLALGFQWFGFPDRLVFSVSFAYRILPALLDEFQNIVFSYRFRGKAPDYDTRAGKLRYIAYRLKIIILSFYPLMLNMAKRSRTITEALVLRGYFYSLKNPDVRRTKLSVLRLRPRDGLFLLTSALWVMASLFLSAAIR